MRSGDKRRRGQQRASTQSKENSVDDDVRCLSGDVGVDEKSGRGSTLNGPVGVWANEVPAAKVVNDNVTFADSNGSRIESGEFDIGSSVRQVAPLKNSARRARKSPRPRRRRRR